jgi:parallel beta-helix repeat protein
MRRYVSILFASSLIATAVASAVPMSAASTVGIKVKPGESIQAAIDGAAVGTEITVLAGTYPEQLLIKTSGLRIVGKGAKLVPPKSPKRNECTDVTRTGPPDKAVAADAGICILGGVTFGEFDSVLTHRPAKLTGQRITGVSIVGLSIADFATGIIIAGADAATIEDVTILKAQAYGALAANATNTAYVGNTVTNGPETIAVTGLCAEASNGSSFRKNLVSGFVNGLCISSSKIKVTGNTLRENHFGIYVDAGMSNIEIRNNKILDNARKDPAPIPTGVGVLIDGATNVRLVANTIKGNVGDNAASFGGMGAGGVLIVDHEGPPDAFVSSNVVATDNKFSSNGKGKTSADVWIVSKGKGFSFKKNSGCLTSNPVGLC